MNKSQSQPVLRVVRFIPVLLFLLVPLLTGSCSTSRTIDADLELEAGSQVMRSVMDSVILIPNGSTLRVNYTAGNRFFVESGGTLSGFTKGGTSSTIYTEPGAQVPALNKQKNIKVIQVESAEENYRERFRKLLPVGAQNESNNARQAAVGGTIYAGGYFGRNYYRSRNFRSNRSFNSSRSVSVKPDSYRSRN